MCLRFGGAGTDGRPGDEIAEILRRNRVEGFGACGQPKFGEFEEKAAGLGHSLVDVKGVVHVRIVDVTLPAGRRPWFLEVDAHHQVERFADFLSECAQPFGVVKAGHRVVDRARADDDKQPAIVAVEDSAQDVAAMPDEFSGAWREWQPGEDLFRRGHRVEGTDVDVVDIEGGHGWRSAVS
ncbi:MAG: hypothetical protein AW07_02890 [Candidatus Accumulibacter sp. SK-11]|nr:MAG: hypothetical protein AW07_02890 [Candidatus Accumulibacter sp. SK-11]